MFGAFSALRSAKNPKKWFLAKPLFWHICYTSRTKLKHLCKKNVLRFFLYKNRSTFFYRTYCTTLAGAQGTRLQVPFRSCGSFNNYAITKGARPAGAGRAPPIRNSTAPPAHIVAYYVLCRAETGAVLFWWYNLPFALIYALKSAILALWQPVFEPVLSALKCLFIDFLWWKLNLCIFGD